MKPEIAEAKKLAAGPLGECLGKFPLLFAKAAFFGQRPSRNQPSEVKNGTITLVDLGNGPLAITCSHVIAAYRERRTELERVIFQIGNVALIPLSSSSMRTRAWT